MSKPFPEREDDEECIGMCVLFPRSEDRQPEKKPKEEERKEKRSKAIGRGERVIKMEQERKLRKLSLQVGRQVRGGGWW